MSLPPCTCIRLTVDTYDASRCERCNPTRAEQAAAEDLCVLCHDWPCRCLRDEIDAEDESAFVQGEDLDVGF